MEEINQNNQEGQQIFKCSGDCLNCRKQPNERREQWQYCAAQFTYNSMRMIGDMQESLRSMQGAINELNAKIEAIQNAEASIFNVNSFEHSNQSNGLDGNHTTQPITPIGAGVNS